jgi:DNA-binding XRE family transcriptional regulator
MPSSVRRHNLARLREQLSLTQGDLAHRVGRSWSTIKAIEIGKLSLSSSLATRISAETGVDRGWLLRNKLSERMPPLKSKIMPIAGPEAALCEALLNVMDRYAEGLSVLQIRRALFWVAHRILDGNGNDA